MKNWNPKANEIFLDAIELDSEAARNEFIQLACGEKPELVAEVLAMLASYDRSSEFLEASKVDTKDSGELNDETVGVYDSRTSNTKATEVGQGTFDQGTMLDRYRIEQVLGSGGMGIVYLAVDTRLNRRVAIKIPRREFHSDTDRRLEREARTMASVKHPNLASLLDVAEWNGIKYLLMEYIEGYSLEERLSDLSQMDQRTIAQWLCKLCSATACAHEAGVVHRDIKPSNIILRPDGEPVLTDFGLAYSDSEDARLTKSGAIIGTPAYMAPEQLLLFSAHRRGGAGLFDLYMSIRNNRDESFVYPIRFGTEINGVHIENRPIWSADNKTLYFESNRPGGNRSADVWCIRRIRRE